MAQLQVVRVSLLLLLLTLLLVLGAAESQPLAEWLQLA